MYYNGIEPPSTSWFLCGRPVFFLSRPLVLGRCVISIVIASHYSVFFGTSINQIESGLEIPNQPSRSPEIMMSVSQEPARDMLMMLLQQNQRHVLVLQLPLQFEMAIISSPTRRTLSGSVSSTEESSPFPGQQTSQP